MATKKKTTKPTFQERVQTTVEKELALYKKAGIKKQLVLHYGQGRPPLLGRLGEWFLKITNAQITTQYIDLQK